MLRYVLSHILSIRLVSGIYYFNALLYVKHAVTRANFFKLRETKLHRIFLDIPTYISRYYRPLRSCCLLATTKGTAESVPRVFPSHKMVFSYMLHAPETLSQVKNTEGRSPDQMCTEWLREEGSRSIAYSLSTHSTGRVG